MHPTGDEFAILLPNTNRSQADIVARDLREAVAANTADLALTASIGVASSDAPGDHILTTADRTLYAIKRQAALNTRR